MPTNKHETLTDAHVIHRWSYADETEREAATGFSPGDVNKLALQIDDGSYWRLADDSPVTWQLVGGADPGALRKTDNLSDLDDAAAARGNLGLGDLAVKDTVSTGDIDDESVTFDKIQDSSVASVLVGRGEGSGAGVLQEITLGSGLTLTGTVLSASGGGGGGGGVSIEDVQDDLGGSFLVVEDGLTKTYNDGSNTLTIGNGKAGALSGTLAALAALSTLDSKDIGRIALPSGQTVTPYAPYVIIKNVRNGYPLLFNPATEYNEQLDSNAIAQTCVWGSAASSSNAASWSDVQFPTFAYPAPLVTQGLGSTIWAEFVITAATGTYRVMVDGARNNNLNDLRLQVSGTAVGSIIPGYRAAGILGYRCHDTEYDISVTNGATQRFTFVVIATARTYSTLKNIYLVKV